MFVMLIIFLLSSFQGVAQSWRTKTAETTNICSFNTAVAQTTDGGYLVASNYWDTISYAENIRFHKIDQDGSILWAKDFVSPKKIVFNDLLACSDGNFLVVGKSDSLSVRWTTGFAIKINSAATVIWEKEFNIDTLLPNNIYNLKIKDAIESKNGGFIITGSVEAQGTAGLFLHKMDNNGATIWTEINADFRAGTTLIENPDNSLLVAVDSFFYPGLSKYSSSGVRLWKKDIPNQHEKIVSIERTPTGYFLGMNDVTWGAPNEIIIRKTDFNGNVLWTNAFQMNDNYLNDMFLMHDGGFFLHGNNQNGALAIKIDSLGNEEWRKEVRGNEEFQSCLVSNDGAFICSGIGLGTKQSYSYNGGTYTVDFVIECGIYEDGDYCPMFSAVTALPNIPNSTPPYTYTWFNGEVGQTVNSICMSYGFGLLITDAVGNSYSAEMARVYPEDNSPELIKLDSLGNYYSNQVTGTIVKDDNKDCAFTTGENGLRDWMLMVDGDESFIVTTDSLGFYSFGVDSGAYNITVPIPNPYFSNCLTNFPFTVWSFDTLKVDWPVETFDCPYMDVSIYHSILRRCQSATYVVNYQNTGTVDAFNASIDITFDTTLTILSSSIPWASQSGNTYSFNLGTVPHNSTVSSFTIETDVSCWTIIGQSICVEAQIFPDTTCLPNPPNWDGSITEIESSCGLDSLTFTLKNIGNNPMTNPQNYFIVEDNLILKTGTFQLTPVQTKEVKMPSNGSTYIMYAEQSPNYYPAGYQPMEAVEACGVNALGTFSIGYLNQFPNTGNLNYRKNVCSPIHGPFDPNDKSATPVGYDIEHYIDQNVNLDYLIRFQNIGTDTAFNVVVRDTLSPHLDITSIQQGAASHAYRLDIVGNNILKFTFPNIQLVDSTTNEPGSHGFVTFNISQQDSLPLGTMIYNSAAIYFDYEAPVITNQTYHEVGKDFIQILISTDNEEQDETTSFNVTVVPNPFAEYADIIVEHPSKSTKALSICDAQGRVVLNAQMENNHYRINRNHLVDGFYFFTISDEQQLISSGKMIVK